MSLAKVQEVNRRLRALGFTVHEWPGWETRTNGYAATYKGGIVHHTGSAYGPAYQALVTGRSDLSGPLCNYSGNSDGSFTVISAGPANHAGASGGRSMGPLPVATRFNPHVLGLEIVYPGTQPMKPEQYRAALAWARVVADVVGGGNIECIRAHAETSITGKWDPGFAPGRTIDMNAFRRDAANFQAAETQDMDQVQDRRLFEIYTSMSQPYTQRGTDVGEVFVQLHDLATSMPGRVDALESKLNQLAGSIGETVRQAVERYLSEHPPTVSVDVAAIAKAVNDEAHKRSES